MASPNRLVITYKVMEQLGVSPVLLNAVYHFGLLTGHYRRVTGKPPAGWEGPLRAVLPIPKRNELELLLGGEGQQLLLAEANEICDGKVRLFGGPPVPLQLTIPGELDHWTSYETGKKALPLGHLEIPDIKFIWEPARFGWAFALGRAYLLSDDDRYAQSFWQYFEIFSDANPPYIGPQWMSGQEVALRLMASVWASQAFSTAAASTPDRKNRLAASVAAHAHRIPPTLVYARSQQNNHLLSEAAGLLTAGLALPEHPQASRWSSMGWKWLNIGIRSQIDGYGEYAQHSTNYQRLMLQIVLWVDAMIRFTGQANQMPLEMNSARWPRITSDAIARATHWLLALLDPDSGRAPNLGANDGAYIFPLTTCPFEDYRPVLHASARAFLNYDLPRGPWDEMSAWFGIPSESRKYIQLPRYIGDQIYGKGSWAYLRTAQFSSRPSHADQLHVDLWWHGINIARDAGSYLYNAAPPWDNQMTAARVHNTVTVNDHDQFTRAGRFLYLDWFDAYRKNAIGGGVDVLQCYSAHYHAYRNPRIRHTRTVTAFVDESWKIEDELLVVPALFQFDGQNMAQQQSSRDRPFMKTPRRQASPPVFRLHWLLPDWEWEVVPLPLNTKAGGCELHLHSPEGWISVSIKSDRKTEKTDEDKLKIGLVRSGVCIYGTVEPSELDGWFSPTYGIRMPALSLSMTQAMPGSANFVTEFIFPK